MSHEYQLATFLRTPVGVVARVVLVIARKPVFVMLFSISTGWPKSHFILLKANKSKPNRAKKIGYISNERSDLGVFLSI